MKYVEIGPVVPEEKIFKDFPMKKLISPGAKPFKALRKIGPELWPLEWIQDFSKI